MTRVLVLLGAFTPLLVFAQEADAPAAVTAVQERYYRLQHEIDVGGGVLPLDPFTKGLYVQGAYVFHLNDYFAWEARGAYNFSLRTSLRQQLERDFGRLPNEFEQVQYFIGSDILWKPLYGKLAALNRWVMHGEGHLSAGATVYRFAGLTSAFRPGVTLGAGLRIFITRWASVRFDLEDTIVVPVGRGTTGLGNVLSFSGAIAINFRATE